MLGMLGLPGHAGHAGHAGRVLAPPAAKARGNLRHHQSDINRTIHIYGYLLICLLPAVTVVDSDHRQPPAAGRQPPVQKLCGVACRHLCSAQVTSHAVVCCSDRGC